MASEQFKKSIFDAIASKRILKTGFVGLPGGIYSSECDSIASHSNVVSILALNMAFECAEEIKTLADYDLNIEKIALMAIYHDFGETKSLDTGAQSKGIYPNETCKLHYLEREGLTTCLSNMNIKDTIVGYFDDYRKYNSPEAILVHIADNIEGFEKAVYSARGNKPILELAFSILEENLTIYKRKEHPTLSKVSNFLVENYLSPTIRFIINTYQIDSRVIPKGVLAS